VRTGRSVAILRRVLLAGMLMSLGGCFLFGGGGEEPVQDPDVVAFAERIDRFYNIFQDTPLDIRATFDNPTLRSYFLSEEDFSAFYASLAAGARRSLLRNATPTRVEIDEFRFESENVAIVDVRFIGRHTRRLRFGEVEIARTDTWRRVDGRWILSPDKL